MKVSLESWTGSPKRILKEEGVIGGSGKGLKQGVIGSDQEDKGTTAGTQRAHTASTARRYTVSDTRRVHSRSAR